MGKVQRDRILAAIPEGGRMLEWGAGGSTCYFAENLPKGATITSIENDAAWFENVRKHLGDRPNVTMRLVPATGPLGTNATAEEEDAANLKDYIRGADDLRGAGFDVILVDGYARNACLAHACGLLKPGGLIFLHDAQRAWYDSGKAGLTALGHIGSCSDYAVPHLWWGCPSVPAHTELHTSSPSVEGFARSLGRTSVQSDYPTIVSFFTQGSAYEQDAKNLIASCRALGLKYEILPMPDLGSWERNCAHKARFLSEALQRHGRSILWVDADAVIRRAPTMLVHDGCRDRDGAGADFGVHRMDGWEFASGTLLFNSTDLSAELLARWTRLCEADPMVWDQVHLANAWEQMVQDRPLRTVWLPPAYTKIYDREATSMVEEPVIEHFQASRRLVSAGSAKRPKPVTPMAQRVALAAARPRSAAEFAQVGEGTAVAGGASGSSVESLQARCKQLRMERDQLWRERAEMDRQLASACARAEGFQRSLVEAAARRLSERGIHRIALYGAGQHSRRVVREPWRSFGIEVVEILDDAPRVEAIDGVRVVAATECHKGVQAIVVSSDAHEALIFEAAKRRFSDREGVVLCTIYSSEMLVVDPIAKAGTKPKLAVASAH